MTSPRAGAVVAAALGAVAALFTWLAIAAPLAMGLVHPWPVDAPGDAPASTERDPAPSAAGRKVAAILLSQAGTEITDFLAPYAILSESGAFDVIAVAPTRDVAPLNGGLGIVPDATLDELDARHPGGADVVVLPNVMDPDSPVLREWVRRQAAHGARVASICEGARLLATTQLLDGREATSHWAALGSLRDAHPTVRWRDDRRWVEDGPFLTSAGVTAAIDASLRIVAREADAQAAARTAAALRLPPSRDPASAPTRFTTRDGITALLEAGFRWPKRHVLVSLDDRIDELPLAAVLDAWPRTFAARTASVAPGRRTVRSRHGLTLVPMLDAAAAGADVMTPRTTDAPAFDTALLDIARTLGGSPAALAAVQLELPVAHLKLDEHPTPVAGPLAALAALLTAGGAAGLLVRRLRRAAQLRRRTRR